MARKFSELRSKLDAAALSRIESRVQAALHEIDLAEVRRAAGLSQHQVALAMDLQQPAVAKIERRSDMLISTLAKYVAATGSVLRISIEASDIALWNSRSSASSMRGAAEYSRSGGEIWMATNSHANGSATTISVSLAGACRDKVEYMVA